MSKDILKFIDKAIPYPIFYRLQFEDRINCLATYKRVIGDKAGNCVIGDYFETGWIKATSPAIPPPRGPEFKVFV